MESKENEGVVCACCCQSVDLVISTDLRAGKIWQLCAPCAKFSQERLAENLAITQGALLTQIQTVLAQKAQNDALMAVIEKFALQKQANAASEAVLKPQPRRKK